MKAIILAVMIFTAGCNARECDFTLPNIMTVCLAQTVQETYFPREKTFSEYYGDTSAANERD